MPENYIPIKFRVEYSRRMPKDRTKLTLPLVKLEHYNRIGRLRMTDYVIDTAPDDPYGDAS